MPGREPYSPKHRTALVLAGSGTAGAYHAGVLRALNEAGVRVDLVAGHGIGMVGACFVAIDGGSRLWAPDGFWRQRAVGGFYRWRPVLRMLSWVAVAALALVLVPLGLLAGGLVAYAIAFVLQLAHVDVGVSIANGYAWLVRQAFQPGMLPSWLAQGALLLAVVALVLLAVASMRARLRHRHRERGRFWWRVFGAPLDARRVVAFWHAALWRLITGGTKVPLPGSLELSRRYAEVLSDNLGQPGFRELLAVVHDVDTRRDLVMAALTEPHRSVFFGRRPGTAGWMPRAGDTLDLVGADRDHVTDVLAAALSLPVVTESWPVTFAPESFWSGETHRLCDRPDAIGRLLEEVLAAGAEQVVVVSATSESPEPHTLTEPRIDGRGRLGEWLAAAQTASMRDALRARAGSFRSIQVIRPAHNPIGPLEFTGTYDDRSDRVQLFGELLDRGYEDAYRQFIEPVVGATDFTS